MLALESPHVLLAATYAGTIMAASSRTGCSSTPRPPARKPPFIPASTVAGAGSLDLSTVSGPRFSGYAVESIDRDPPRTRVPA